MIDETVEAEHLEKRVPFMEKKYGRNWQKKFDKNLELYYKSLTKRET